MAKKKIEVSETLRRGIIGTWGQIAADLEGERISNRGAVELCIDADRLATFGYKEADAELRALIITHGDPSRILKALAKEVQLV